MRVCVCVCVSVHTCTARPIALVPCTEQHLHGTTLHEQPHPNPRPLPNTLHAHRLAACTCASALTRDRPNQAKQAGTPQHAHRSAACTHASAPTSNRPSHARNTPQHAHQAKPSKKQAGTPLHSHRSAACTRASAPASAPRLSSACLVTRAISATLSTHQHSGCTAADTWPTCAGVQGTHGGLGSGDVRSTRCAVW